MAVVTKKIEFCRGTENYLPIAPPQGVWYFCIDIDPATPSTVT